MSGSDSQRKLRVLVADDEFLAAVHLETLLSDLGHDCVGKVARIDQIETKTHETGADCVVLDVNFRGEYVYPAARALLDDGVHVILVTGYNDLPEAPSGLEKALRLSKPVSTAALASALDQVVVGDDGRQPG